MKNLYLICLLFMSLFLVNCFSTSGGGGSDPVVVLPPATNDGLVLNYTYNQLPGTMPDYNKDFDGSERNLCWAVSLCNAMEYNGWVVDNRLCVSRLRENFGNVPGSTAGAFDWYLDTYLGIQNENSHKDSESDVDNVPLHIADALDSGNPVILGLASKSGKFGHAVTVFGYEWDQSTETWLLLVVDGDDSWHTRFIHVEWMGTHWSIVHSGVYNDFTIKYSTEICPVPVIG